MTFPFPAVALFAAASLACLPGCSSPERPPWADGALITERVPDTGAVQSLRNLPERILAVHNRERRAAGVAPLTWDSALASAAAAYGPQLARYGRLQHSQRETRAGQGENLWMGTRGGYSLEEMVGSWVKEKIIFTPGLFPDAVSRSGNWSDVAHYTQMVWPRTTRVGCALHKAAEWDYLICRYAPAGNVVGQRVP